jgi:3-phosphoshikimate 1-carboxyvinyltransferase
LQALFSNITLDNTSNSDDSEVMQMALNGTEELIDIHHAGTTMRFLTAYFATGKSYRNVLDRSRMQERPVKILVEALEQLGAQISYLKLKFPPIKINGQNNKFKSYRYC